MRPEWTKDVWDKVKGENKIHESEYQGGFRGLKEFHTEENSPIASSSQIVWGRLVGIFFALIVGWLEGIKYLSVVTVSGVVYFGGARATEIKAGA